MCSFCASRYNAHNHEGTIRDSELHKRWRNSDKNINSKKCSSSMFTVYFNAALSSSDYTVWNCRFTNQRAGKKWLWHT